MYENYVENIHYLNEQRDKNIEFNKNKDDDVKARYVTAQPVKALTREEWEKVVNGGEL